MTLTQEEIDTRFVHRLIKEAVSVEEPNDDDLLAMLQRRDKVRDRQRMRDFMFDVLQRIKKQKKKKAKEVKQMETKKLDVCDRLLGILHSYHVKEDNDHTKDVIDMIARDVQRLQKEMK